jgi:hypothetical protein
MRRDAHDQAGSSCEPDAVVKGGRLADEVEKTEPYPIPQESAFVPLAGRLSRAVNKRIETRRWKEWLQYLRYYGRQPAGREIHVPVVLVSWRILGVLRTAPWRRKVLVDRPRIFQVCGLLLVAHKRIVSDILAVDVLEIFYHVLSDAESSVLEDVLLEELANDAVDEMPTILFFREEVAPSAPAPVSDPLRRFEQRLVLRRETMHRPPLFLVGREVEIEVRFAECRNLLLQDHKQGANLAEIERPGCLLGF